MKRLIILSLVLVSFSSHAHGIKRLTTTYCYSEDLQSFVSVKWDSSITPIGPVQVEINGEKVRPIMELGDDYTGLSGNLKNEAKFSTTIESTKHFQTKLLIDDNETILTCDTNTKFRLF